MKRRRTLHEVSQFPSAAGIAGPSPLSRTDFLLPRLSEAGALRRGDAGLLRAARSAGILRLRSEEHTSELQSQSNLVCRLLLEKKKNTTLTPAWQVNTRMSSRQSPISP